MSGAGGAEGCAGGAAAEPPPASVVAGGRSSQEAPAAPPSRPLTPATGRMPPLPVRPGLPAPQTWTPALPHKPPRLPRDTLALPGAAAGASTPKPKLPTPPVPRLAENAWGLPMFAAAAWGKASEPQPPTGGAVEGTATATAGASVETAE